MASPLDVLPGDRRHGGRPAGNHRRRRHPPRLRRRQGPRPRRRRLLHRPPLPLRTCRRQPGRRRPRPEAVRSGNDPHHDAPRSVHRSRSCALEGRDLIRHRSEAFTRTPHAEPGRPAGLRRNEDPLMKTSRSPAAAKRTRLGMPAVVAHGRTAAVPSPPAGRRLASTVDVRRATPPARAPASLPWRSTMPPRSCSRNRSSQPRCCASPSPPTSRRPSSTVKAPRT